MDNAIIQELAELRKALHRQPRLSGDEGDTAALIAGFISRYKPDEILAPIGGTGLAAVYNGTGEGPSTMIRCELDALPLVEAPGHDHVSEVHGIYHACGHDGHMAIAAGLAPLVSGKRLARGRVVLLFQPAEETGTGARGIIEDAVFPKISGQIFAPSQPPRIPYWAYRVMSAFACASLGMVITLREKKAHASNYRPGEKPGSDTVHGLMPLSALHGKKALRRLIRIS
jgi:metal-dependent amidase/aminoacylase/carboxypeptidase family protein